MPNVRQIRADKNEIIRRERSETIPHNTVAAALQHECELILRMEMPLRAIAGALHDFAVKGLMRGMWDGFKNGLA